MAMFIKLARGTDVAVHLGNSLPASVVNDLQNVTAVQASDKELERLQKINRGHFVPDSLAWFQVGTRLRLHWQVP